MPHLLFTAHRIMYPRISPKMATSSGLFLATIYNQSQLAERKHVTRILVDKHCGNGCSINRAPLSVSYYNEISGGYIGRAVVRRCSAGPVLPLWFQLGVFRSYRKLE